MSDCPTGGVNWSSGGSMEKPIQQRQLQPEEFESHNGNLLRWLLTKMQTDRNTVGLGLEDLASPKWANQNSRCRLRGHTALRSHPSECHRSAVIIQHIQAIVSKKEPTVRHPSRSMLSADERVHHTIYRAVGPVNRSGQTGIAVAQSTRHVLHSRSASFHRLPSLPCQLLTVSCQEQSGQRRLTFCAK
jgi:hypothetical protein